MNALRILLALLPVAVVGIGAGRWWQTRPAAAERELRVGVVGRLPGLDYRVARAASDPAQRLADALWEPLLVADVETSSARPAAAESWEVLDGGRRMILRLDPQGRWSNGEPVTAQDFVRSARWSLDGGFPHNLINQLVGTDEYLSGECGFEQVGIRALDARHLELEFRQPPGDPAGVVAGMPFMPLHPSTPAALSAGAKDRVTPDLVGNGPFVLVEHSPREILLRRNPQHRHADRVALDRVRLVCTEGQAMLPALFAAGRIDQTTAMNGKTFLAGDRLPAGVQLWEEDSANISLLHFNLSRPPLNDVRVRRALSLALDREAIARRFEGERARAAWSLTPLVHEAEATHTVEENLAEARRLLAEAGYPEGRGFPILRAPIVSAGESNPLLYFCADQWRQRLGIRVYVAPLTAGEVMARSARGEFDMMHYYWTLTPTMVSAVSGQVMAALPPGFTDWDQRPVADLVQQAWHSTGAERRRRLLVAERALLEQMPVTPLTTYRMFYLKHDRVAGWKRDIYGSHPFAEMAVSGRNPDPTP